MFIIYLNDIFKVDTCGEIISYADDTVIILKGNTWKEVIHIAQNEFFKLQNWFQDNLLTINIKKTQALAFGCYYDSLPKENHIECHKKTCIDNLSCNCPKIKLASSVKYLGIVIDNHLCWDLHVQNLICKLKYIPCVFYKLRPILIYKQLLNVYYALVDSILSYGIIGWGGARDNVLQALQTVQKCTSKVLLKKNRRFSTIQLYNLRKVTNLRQKFYITALHHCLKQNLITVNKPYENSKITRSYTDHKFQSVKIHKTIGQRLFTYQAVKIINYFTPEARKIILQSTLYSRKKKIQEAVMEISLDSLKNLVNS